MTVCFIFENVITRFVYPKVFMTNQGAQFLNDTIHKITQEFMMHHHKITPYHPQDNGTVEAFDNILELSLTKVCNVQCDDWDQCIPVVFWAYRTTCKWLLSILHLGWSMEKRSSCH
jgi:transposase InsO family protein